MSKKSKSAKPPRRASKNRKRSSSAPALDGTQLPRLIQERENHEKHKHPTSSKDILTKMMTKNRQQKEHEHEVFVEALHYWCSPATN